MVGGEHGFKFIENSFKDLFNAKMFDEITAANIALPKYGLDNGTSASAILQVRLGLDRFLLNLIGRFNFAFSI